MVEYRERAPPNAQCRVTERGALLDGCEARALLSHTLESEVDRSGRAG
jgi:hypothetical protein